jgi:mannose-6-phosphate isomerase-like protein (cupin superfamily)
MQNDEPGANGIVASPAGRAREGFGDPARGTASWVTLFSGDVTPTRGMSAGVMELPADGGTLEPHRHAQAEIYYIAEGSGLLSINGVEQSVSAGAAVFIPGNALHALRNVSGALLKVFYVFPADSFAEIIYHFPGQS